MSETNDYQKSDNDHVLVELLHPGAKKELHTTHQNHLHPQWQQVILNFFLSKL